MSLVTGVDTPEAAAEAPHFVCAEPLHLSDMADTPLIAVVVGTRPEVIKMAPVVRALAQSTTLRPLLISTGQQREMTRQALATFDLRPEVDLDVMEPNQQLPALHAKLLTRVASTLETLRPAAVLVHGDTTTALASAQAAFYRKIPLGHVEAGLRTYDFANPWPEEMNRRLIDPLCRWCFAPTESSRDNLLAEHVPAAHIVITGNTVIDALLQTHSRLAQSARSAEEIGRRNELPEDFVQRFLTPDRTAPLMLVTGHRRESFGQGFADICRGILATVEAHPNLGVVYPVHLNPNVQEPVRRLLGSHPRIRLIEPVGYEEFILLMGRAHLILTDSGGVQEEAPSLGKPVLVMRTTTERPEGIAAGTCRLVGTDPARIVAEASLLLNDGAEYARRSTLRNPYGDGHAAEKIAAALARDLSPPS